MNLERLKDGVFYNVFNKLRGMIMKIIIDARMVDDKLHGIARYTYEIINKLAYENDLDITLLVNNLDLSKDIFKNDKLKFIKMKSPFLSPNEQVELPYVLNKFKDVLFHSPSFVSSPLIKCKSVMTIHDLNHIKFPQYYSKLHKYYYKYIVKNCVLKAEKIITVSQYSKEELLKWLRCSEDKIEVTYNGLDKKFCLIDDVDKLEKVKHKYDLPKKYMLYIGNQKPHKNVKRLLEAISLLEDNITLVINGTPNDDIKNFLRQYKIKNKVKFIGYVDDKDLPALYNLAYLFIFPSLYEGFGLPPLEAMACGCPVITSNTSSLPEVVGDAALLIDPYSCEEIAEAIRKLLRDNSLYQELIKKGLANAHKFSWSITTKHTLNIYENILRS